MKRDIKELKRDILEFHDGKLKLVYTSQSRTSLETLISTQDIFLKSNLYVDIIDSTQFLPNSVTIYHRIKAILDEYTEYPLCPICNKRPLKINKNYKKSLFSKNCCEIECNIKNMVEHICRQSEDTREKHKMASLKFRNSVKDLYKNIYSRYINLKYTVLPYDEVRKEIINRKNNQIKNSPIIRLSEYENNVDFICSVIYHTRFIKTKNETEDLTNNFFKFTERTYCIFNDMREYNRCEYCGEYVTTFDKNWKIGYRSVCSKPSCGTAKASKHRTEKNMILFKEKLKNYGYELITDNNNKQGRGKIRHECGTEFETNFSDIFLHSKKGNKNKFKNFDKLCPKCFPRENITSRWEIEVRDFCSDICKEDKFSFNDRKILFPYEIDILDITKNIGIECDGAVMHSSDKKNEWIHRWKTDECERNGIELIHFIDNEWYLKQDTIKSIICRKMGVYEHIKNCDCIKKEISQDECNSFFLKNNLLTFEKCQFNNGIFLKDVMIGCYSYESKGVDVKICNMTIKNGYDIENIVRLASDEFKDKNITIFEDRRLFLFRNRIEECGFSIERKTKSKCLKINRMLTHRIYDRYFGAKTNNENNIYDVDDIDRDMIIRYFDCGNLVYVKRY